jgi:hypothetical protein
MAAITLKEPTTFIGQLRRDRVSQLIDETRTRAAELGHKLTYWRTSENLTDRDGSWTAMKCDHCHAKLVYSMSYDQRRDGRFKYEDRIIERCTSAPKPELGKQLSFL